MKKYYFREFSNIIIYRSEMIILIAFRQLISARMTKFQLNCYICIFRGYLPISPYIYIGVEVFRLSNSLQNFICTFSNMSIISASAKRWSGGVEWSGVFKTPNWSRVLIEHMNRGVFQSPVGTIVPSCT